MNRRQKIIVSITGIFIVLLALVGLTYAYFLTQIKGNTNPTSVTLSTANLVLEYKDGNGELRAANKLTPDTDILFNKIENGEVVVDADGNPVVVNSKTFSVENKGNEDVENYAVTVENYSLTYVTSGKDSDGKDVVAGAETTFKYPETLVINITCTSNKGTCNGVENGTFPESNDILLYNDIEVGEKHEYTLTMKYIDNGENQSADMNKTLSAQINIIDANNTVDLTGEVATYALGDYVQINSEPKTSRIVKNKDGKYIYKIVGVKPDDHELGVYNKSNTETPKGSSELSIVKGTEASVVGNVITITDASREVNVDITSTYNLTISDKIEELIYGYTWENAPEGTLLFVLKAINEVAVPKTIPGEESSAADEAILASAEDDYGTSYYFRGNVENNYINYSGKCWRIVRVQGDGKIKLVLADKNGECNVDTYSVDNMNSSIISENSNITLGKYKYNETPIPTELNNWLPNIDTSEMVETEWCSDMSISSIYDVEIDIGKYITEYDFGGSERINPTFKCDMTGLNDSSATKIVSKIGLLTSDEYLYAGAIHFLKFNYEDVPSDSDMYEDFVKTFQDYYLTRNGFLAGTMTPGRDAQPEETSYLNIGDMFIEFSDHIYIRPAIALKSTVRVSYDADSEYEIGTYQNPYIIN